jgi:hypothetical protein
MALLVDINNEIFNIKIVNKYKISSQIKFSSFPNHHGIFKIIFEIQNLNLLLHPKLFKILKMDKFYEKCYYDITMNGLQ